MKIYHGTREGILDFVMKKGIRPRKGRKGNWQHTINSNPKAVYLTVAYAIHYAQCAVGPRSDKLLILEIDTDLLDYDNLAPDEDFLEQATRDNPDFRHVHAWEDMGKRTRWFRHRAHSNFATYWEMSIAGLGNCAYYKTIPK